MKSKTPLALVLMMLLLLLVTLCAGFASAAFWKASIGTDSTSWTLFRESENMSFRYESHVSGKIEPVNGPKNTTLNSWHSSFFDANFNDVRLSERTAALQGDYKTDEITGIMARNDASVESEISKPVGSDEYSILYHETWPVGLIQRKSMAYNGSGINTREFSGNNMDYVGTNFLYNKNLIKDVTVRMTVVKLNATLVANDQSIEKADLDITRSTDFRFRARSNGISDIRYLQSGPSLQEGSVPRYQVQNFGEQRYVGSYDMTKIITMKNREDRLASEDYWLPCCFSGWEDMATTDTIGFGEMAKKVFDCSCANSASK